MFKKRRMNKRGVSDLASVFTFFGTLLATLFVTMIIGIGFNNMGAGVTWGIIIFVVGIIASIILKNKVNSS